MTYFLVFRVVEDLWEVFERGEPVFELGLVVQDHGLVLGDL